MRGGERPRLVPAELNLVSGSVPGMNLRSSDYQKLPPGSAGYDWRFPLASVDTSGCCVLVLDVGGCSG